jgi:hypothetical protein
MSWSSILGLVSLLALVSVIVFAFRQGEKVRKAPEGVPPEHTSGGTFT